MKNLAGERDCDERATIETLKDGRVAFSFNQGFDFPASANPPAGIPRESPAYQQYAAVITRWSSRSINRGSNGSSLGGKLGVG